MSVELESSGRRSPQAGRVGDHLLVRQVANGANDGYIRVNVHDRIFRFRISQPSTHATLSYAGRVTVGGQSLEKMEALKQKLEAMLSRVFTRETVQNVREINFNLHRAQAGAPFALSSFRTRANDSAQWDHRSVGIPIIGVRAQAGQEIGQMEELFTACENDRIEEARRHRQNPPGPVPHNAPGNGASPRNHAGKKKRRESEVNLDLNKLAPRNKPKPHKLKRSGSHPNLGSH